MQDRETGRSRGFGFVTYGSSEEADHAVSSMNEQELDGRRLKVNLANARPSGGGGGGESDVTFLQHELIHMPLLKDTAAAEAVVVEAGVEARAAEAVGTVADRVVEADTVAVEATVVEEDLVVGATAVRVGATKVSTDTLFKCVQLLTNHLLTSSCSLTGSPS